MIMKREPKKWVEINAKIVNSIISSSNWGTEVAHARNESRRRVKLTVSIPINPTETILATKSFWTYTKNRNFFQEGEFVTILYNAQKPTQFKLKYDI